VLFRTVVASAIEFALVLARESAVCVDWAEVHRHHCISSVSEEVMRCHPGKDEIHACGFDKA